MVCLLISRRIRLGCDLKFIIRNTTFKHFGKLER